MSFLAAHFTLLCASCMQLSSSVASSRMRMLDMTHSFDNRTHYWPDQWDFYLKPVHIGPYEDKFWYEANDFCAGEHGGTHMDAPCHFARGGWTIDRLPLSRLILPAYVINIRQRAAHNPDAQITVDDVTNLEAECGLLPAASVVLQCSGWDERWGDRAAYFGNDRKDVKNFHFPGIHHEAARLLAERGVHGVGVDTPSVDHGREQDSFPTHVTLSAHNMFILENVLGSCAIPRTGATLYIFPMKIRGGSGAPVRIVAMWEENGGKSGSPDEL